MDVRVDRARCLGAGMCALTAPQVFDQDQEEGLVTLLAARPAREQHAAVRGTSVVHFTSSARSSSGEGEPGTEAASTETAWG